MGRDNKVDSPGNAKKACVAVKGYGAGLSKNGQSAQKAHTDPHDYTKVSMWIFSRRIDLIKLPASTPTIANYERSVHYDDPTEDGA